MEIRFVDTVCPEDSDNADEGDGGLTDVLSGKQVFFKLVNKLPQRMKIDKCDDQSLQRSFKEVVVTIHRCVEITKSSLCVKLESQPVHRHGRIDAVILTATDLRKLVIWKKDHITTSVSLVAGTPADEFADSAKKAMQSLYAAGAFPGSSKSRSAVGLEDDVLIAMGKLVDIGMCNRTDLNGASFQLSRRCLKSLRFIDAVSGCTKLSRLESAKPLEEQTSFSLLSGLIAREWTVVRAHKDDVCPARKVNVSAANTASNIVYIPKTAKTVNVWYLRSLVMSEDSASRRRWLVRC